MCRRYHFDNLLSLVGAWVMFLIPFYWFIRTLIEWRHDCKYCTYRSYFHTLKESLWELNWRYWWSC